MRRSRAHAHRWSRCIAIALLFLAAPGATGVAQGVHLRIQPRPGDTLHTRLEQRVEMAGTKRLDGTDSTRRSEMRYYYHSRLIALRADTTGTLVRAIFDSVAIGGTELTAAALEEARRALTGQEVLLHLSRDGATQTVNGAAGPAQARFPAVLPDHRVRVGETWTRELRLPLPGAAAAPYELTATFRLDSLTAGGRYAHLSLRGELAHDDPVPEIPAGTAHAVTGRLSGVMQIDLRSGWLVGSRLVLSTESVLTPADPSAKPMRVRMRMTQRMRAMDNH